MECGGLPTLLTAEQSGSELPHSRAPLQNREVPPGLSRSPQRQRTQNRGNPLIENAADSTSEESFSVKRVENKTSVHYFQSCIEFLRLLISCGKSCEAASPRLVNNKILGPGEAFQVYAYASESPNIWRWTHVPFFGGVIEGNTIEDSEREEARCRPFRTLAGASVFLDVFRLRRGAGSAVISTSPRLQTFGTL